MNNKKYVLITPARNEQAYIESTIQSVIKQTILPEKWVIVSDGSTDGTDEIVKRYVKHNAFIQLVRISGEATRNFASKVYAINAGYELLRNFKYEFIGNLDADVTFDKDYYENILQQFAQNQKLGVAGGLVFDLIKGKYRKQNISLNSVAGPIQMFRRKCYEDIGGYIPLQFGGVDAAAEIMARMKGWEVQSFLEINVYQQRRVGTAEGNILSVRFRQGLMFYMLGYHPLFQLVRCISRLKDGPYIIGAVLELISYYWSYLKGYKIQLPDNVVKYLRKEQMRRLQNIFFIKKQIKRVIT